MNMADFGWPKLDLPIAWRLGRMLANQLWIGLPSIRLLWPFLAVVYT